MACGLLLDNLTFVNFRGHQETRPVAPVAQAAAEAGHPARNLVGNSACVERCGKAELITAIHSSIYFALDGS